MAQLALASIVIFSLLALSLATIPAAPAPCLFNNYTGKILPPISLPLSACPNNATTCMNFIYKYGNFQYNGPANLKPVLGEAVMFIVKYPDAAGTYHVVTMLNANVTTRMNVTTSMTGTAPTNLELYDDPAVPTNPTTTDSWAWDSATNTGKFTWVTQPAYTDGVIIGPVTFLDNYCIKGVFSQPNLAISKLSILSGTYANPVRLDSVPYTSGSTFEFCQYPKTVTVSNDVTCPGYTNGNATVTIVVGPSNVTYTWYNSAGNAIGTSNTITGLAAGNYTVYVNDTTLSGCSANRLVVIKSPTLYAPTVSVTPFTCVVQGTATVTPVGGAGSFTYQWMQGSTVIGTGTSISNLAVGTYSVKVTDKCGSVATTSFSVGTTGCCGDGICQANEACGTASFCTQDCGTCCPPGTYTVSGSCVVCAPGSSSNTWGATSCPQCPANSFNAGSNDSCIACPDNTYSAAGSGVCINCACGTVRATGQSSCSACGAGTFADCSSGTCKTCAAGTYSQAGWSLCQPCDAGKFVDSTRASCNQCAAGTYAASGSSSCTPCPSGTNSAVGSAHKDACTA